MRILVDILHPAHAHVFRHPIREWTGAGHEVLVTARDKDVACRLLDAFGIPYRLVSRRGRGLLGLFGELVARDLRLLRIARAFRPDVLTGCAGISIAHVGRLIGRPSIVFYNNEEARLQNRLTYPFATVVCTPACYAANIGAKHVRYPGYQELAYLHPQRFRPDRRVLSEAGLGEGERFAIIRFVSWEASHDVGQGGFDARAKRRLVAALAQHVRPIISSERALPEDLAAFAATIRPERMHDLMAFADLCIGESATMASECACLGVPAIYVASSRRGYTDHQEERWGLTLNFGAEQADEAIAKAVELSADPHTRAAWGRRRAAMLAEYGDVSEWIIDFVASYPCGAPAHRQAVMA